MSTNCHYISLNWVVVKDLKQPPHLKAAKSTSTTHECMVRETQSQRRHISEWILLLCTSHQGQCTTRRGKNS